MSKGLLDHGFEQLVKEATHIRGGHINHAYFRDTARFFETPIIERYSPYYSYHDAVCLVLKRRLTDKTVETIKTEEAHN